MVIIDLKSFLLSTNTTVFFVLMTVYFLVTQQLPDVVVQKQVCFTGVEARLDVDDLGVLELFSDDGELACFDEDH